MWLMLQTEKPEDFVIATGEVHSVREFVERAFKHVGKTIVWEGKDENEIGRCKETGVVHVKVDPKFFRPTEVRTAVLSGISFFFDIFAVDSLHITHARVRGVCSFLQITQVKMRRDAFNLTV
ncbi:hypothetical protein AMECASPLE_015132 [Ameca splendens]|uniref:GDP-mannose 4,6-dehydratase n=1 Tax=Ameca splendens TaxID=208324 RepID=A0ABV0ZMN3_9TELE